MGNLKTYRNWLVKRHTETERELTQALFLLNIKYKMEQSKHFVVASYNTLTAVWGWGVNPKRLIYVGKITVCIVMALKYAAALKHR